MRAVLYVRNGSKRAGFLLPDESKKMEEYFALQIAEEEASEGASPVNEQCSEQRPCVDCT